MDSVSVTVSQGALAFREKVRLAKAYWFGALQLYSRI